MTETNRLDPAKLLGFGRDGAPLHELVIAAGTQTTQPGAQGSVRAQGSPKPVGFVKAQGDLKPAGGVKPLGSIKTAGIGGKVTITPVGISKADGFVKAGKG